VTTSRVAEAVTEFARAVEPSLRLALVAAFGVKPPRRQPSESLLIALKPSPSFNSQVKLGYKGNRSKKRAQSPKAVWYFSLRLLFLYTQSRGLVPIHTSFTL